MGQALGSQLDGGADAGVGAAATDIAAHRVFDILIRRLRGGFQQAYRRHDLACLAVAALSNVPFYPGLLHRLAHCVCLYPFDSGNAVARGGRKGGDAGADWSSVHVHGTGTAQCHATSELGARHAKLIPQGPEQGRFTWRVDVLRLAVNLNVGHSGILGRQAWNRRIGRDL